MLAAFNHQLMKMFLLFFLLSTTGFTAADRELIRANIQIEQFDKKPADCGIIKWVSVYKAHVVDHKSRYFGEDIIVYVVCREAWGKQWQPNQPYSASLWPLNKGDVIDGAQVFFCDTAKLRSAKRFQLIGLY
jgi:hypothetical protein